MLEPSLARIILVSDGQTASYHVQPISPDPFHTTDIVESRLPQTY